MFSGGRDSTVLLSLAADLARRHGYQPPIPYTQRHPGVPEADETAWQEEAVRRLRLDDWVRKTITDEHDFVGPAATWLLQRLGPRWPPNLHSHLDGARAAAGGSLITGAFGDEIFTQVPRMVRLRRVLTGRVVPRLRDVATLAVRGLPPSIAGRLWLIRGDPKVPSWLRPDIARHLARRVAVEVVANPIGWAAELRYWWRQRPTQLLRRSLAELGRVTGTEVVAPFGHPRVLGAVARHWRFDGPSDRTAAMEELFGDVVDPAILRRRSKATFDAVYWGEATRRFAREWSGAASWAGLADPETLRAVWRWQPGTPVHPNQFHAALALQVAWLETRPRTRKKDPHIGGGV